jgi:hypothetical protein
MGDHAVDFQNIRAKYWGHPHDAAVVHTQRPAPASPFAPAPSATLANLVSQGLG